VSEFSVIAAAKKKDVQGQNGPMQVIALTLDDGSAAPVLAEWFTKASTPLPAPGQKLDGTLEDSQYGKKFKKAQHNGGFGGKRDPATEKRITRQHSQDMAIETLKLAHSLGHAPELDSVKAIVGAVKTLAEVYDKDAWEAGS
jgi:hypothetical protein